MTTSPMHSALQRAVWALRSPSRTAWVVATSSLWTAAEEAPLRAAPCAAAAANGVAPARGGRQTDATPRASEQRGSLVPLSLQALRWRAPPEGLSPCSLTSAECSSAQWCASRQSGGDVRGFASRPHSVAGRRVAAAQQRARMRPPPPAAHVSSAEAVAPASPPHADGGAAPPQQSQGSAHEVAPRSTDGVQPLPASLHEACSANKCGHMARPARVKSPVSRDARSLAACIRKLRINPCRGGNPARTVSCVHVTWWCVARLSALPDDVVHSDKSPAAVVAGAQIADVVNRDALLVTRDIEWCASSASALQMLKQFVCLNGMYGRSPSDCCVLAAFAGARWCSASSRPTSTPCLTRTATQYEPTTTITPLTHPALGFPCIGTERNPNHDPVPPALTMIPIQPHCVLYKTIPQVVHISDLGAGRPLERPRVGPRHNPALRLCHYRKDRGLRSRPTVRAVTSAASSSGCAAGRGVRRAGQRDWPPVPAHAPRLHRNCPDARRCGAGTVPSADTAPRCHRRMQSSSLSGTETAYTCIIRFSGAVLGLHKHTQMNAGVFLQAAA